MQRENLVNIRDLATTVQKTYFSRFGEMALEYQLHFASRLYAWTRDEEAARRLEVLKPRVMPADHKKRVQVLQGIRDELVQKDFQRDINNYVTRKPYFAKYPQLLLVHNALFRIRHWYCIYGTDERESLFKLMPRADLEKMLHQLQRDDSAFRTLSTYAVNTLYLFDKLYSPPLPLVDMTHIFVAAQGFDHGSKNDLQLLQYLYTHCILGETLFYVQPVTQRQEAYRRMLRELEEIIDINYDTTTLDNKFEFLVCARVCGFATGLADRIYHEATLSLNTEGFIVDTLNRHINPVKQTFLMSEHRNVLFILGTTNPAFSRPTANTL